jgi:Putative Ig domain
LTRNVTPEVAPNFALNTFHPVFALIVLLISSGLMSACGTAAQARDAVSSKTIGELVKSISLAIPEQPAKVGTAYSVVPTVSGGLAPYRFAVESGTLPPGLTLNPHTGAFAGMPTTAGKFTFTLAVSDSTKNAPITSLVHIAVAADDSGSAKNVTIAISPTTASLSPQQMQQFSASLTGTANTAVIWSSTAGTISKSGEFTAPAANTNMSVIVTATSLADGSLNASAAVTVIAQTPLAITTSALLSANSGVPYRASLAATGGTSPYQWSISSGALPAGISLQSSTGSLVGTTTLSGSFSFTVKVSDSAGKTATRSFNLESDSSTSSNPASGFDGPAELPRVYLQTAMANTPAPGSTIAVKSASDLQSALSRINCGDTLELQAGASFAGQFTFPARNCSDNQWIIVRTSATDSALPPEGSRLTPCYAGVASLPGRPALNCASMANVVAKLVMPISAVGPILFAPGANHYRFIGLEITRAAGTGIVYSLASASNNGTISNIIFDRVWMHGSSDEETKHGVELAGASSVSVIDSFLTDFHCTALSGACTDAAAIAGGVGNPVGPFKIVNNFLEASGENVLFGGAPSDTTPADIEIRQNHFFKPMTWMRGQPGHVSGREGNPFIVKNFIELKNAQRVLVEGNVLENTWGGFSQKGYAIVLTPKNQAAARKDVCPTCMVTDVTIRYNTISHVGGGLQIANALSDNGAVALDGERYSIHDITIDDIDLEKYSGTGHLAEIETDRGAPLLRSVAIQHITAFPQSGLFTIGGNEHTKMPAFSFENNLVTVGSSPVWSIGGGPANCAYYDKPLTTFIACFSEFSFTKNALIGTPASYPVRAWPQGNAFPSNVNAVGFVNYHDGNGGDYRLLPSSPYKNAGTDGKDLGADVETIEAKTAGVY